MASPDATAIPIKNQAYRVTFPIFDADGDLVTGATGLDSEVSKDGDTFADCNNEATEIATSSGMYYLDLTATEMNADTVAVIVKSSGKTTPLVLYPAEPADIVVNVKKVNDTDQTAGDLASLITTVDDFLDTEIAAIKAKTDNLPSDPADASDIAASFSGVNTKLDTIDDFLDTEVAAIKAKTDNLPSDPADASDIAAAFGTVNSTLATIAAYVDTEIAALQTDLTTLLSRLSAARAGYLDNLSAGAVALQSSVDDLEGRLTSGRAAALDNLDATISSRASQASVDTIDNFVDTEIASLVSDVATVLDRLTAARAGYLDQLNSAMELDGAAYRFTENALEQAPAGGGGGGDGFTADDREVLEAIDANVAAMSAAEVTIVSPVSASGDITIVRGDDYFQADGRALSFTFTGQPNLTGATVKMHIWHRSSVIHERYTITGAVVSATQVRFELTTTETARLKVPTEVANYNFCIEATLASSSHVATVHTGKLYVTED